MNMENYRKNAHGDLVHVDNIKEVDLLRDETVIEMMDHVFNLQKEMMKTKETLVSSFKAFVELSAEKYGAKLGGKQGNTTIYSFDGRYKVIYAINKRISLDERINAAKSLIDACIHEWSQGSRPEIITLINQAFKVDKDGNLNTKRILELRSLEIKDERWKSAMDAISDAIQVVDSKEYMRFYERNESGEYVQISLDFAGI